MYGQLHALADYCPFTLTFLNSEVPNETVVSTGAVFNVLFKPLTRLPVLLHSMTTVY